MAARHGVALRIHPGPLVEFSSLPADLRDAALVARGQMALPLPSPDHNILERRHAGPCSDLKGPDHAR
ncbi:MAG: hypothetical protein Q4G25_12700 [Paracoccus sp. (in: a-proteobacteria)]|nr:hypothetical protein [Paracoccus sp. (in: a-proteobacteria)]